MNPKIVEVENKIPNTSSLFTTNVLDTKSSKVENRIPDNFKHITTQECNTLTVENCAARLNQADLVNKTDFDNQVTYFNRNL